MNDFPLIYCNGDSYSDETYHHTLKNSTYAHTIGNHCGGFVLNKAISGSCNRRIIRTTLHDVIHQRELNANQKIVALIGLTFELRSEVWIDNKLPTISEESQFFTHTFSGQLNWRQNLLKGKKIFEYMPFAANVDKFFYKKYSEGRAYFFSPYAERINLLTDLIMLKNTFEALNIDFLIFQSPKAEKLQQEYLIDFFKNQIEHDQRFFDLENFGFCDWCFENGFKPLDFLDRPSIGHYGPDAHKAFAQSVLIPKLQQLQIL